MYNHISLNIHITYSLKLDDSEDAFNLSLNIYLLVYHLVEWLLSSLSKSISTMSVRICILFLIAYKHSMCICSGSFFVQFKHSLDVLVLWCLYTHLPSPDWMLGYCGAMLWCLQPDNLRWSRWRSSSTCVRPEYMISRNGIMLGPAENVTYIIGGE